MRYFQFGLIFLIMTTAIGRDQFPSLSSDSIRLNQIGYFPQATKRAIVVELNADRFEVLTVSGTVVFAGELSEPALWESSGESVQVADFSDLNVVGEYRIKVGDQISYSFKVGEYLFEDALVASMKSYYYHRTGVDLETAHAGIYARKKDHMYEEVVYHESTGKQAEVTSSLGGWLDAGDYGKYVVNAGVTVSTMLHLYELYPGILSDKSLNIPESGNQRSDLLDELKFELDWMLLMQDSDGGVFHKVTALGFEGFAMPDQIDDQRYIIGKSTNASIVHAGTAAQAARVFERLDPVYANQLLESAQNAWEWANANPDELFTKNPEDVHTGSYNSGDLSDEFFWAATELFLTTKNHAYSEYARTHAKPLIHQIEESWRTYYLYLSYYSQAIHGDLIDGVSAKESVLGLADGQLAKLETHPYKISIDHFVWGSNSDILNQAMLFQMAHYLSGDLKYLHASLDMMDYIFGKNAVGYSFLSGFGSKQVMHFHDRLSESDGIDLPLPGFIAGGPNVEMQDKENLAKSGVHYASELPAKAYIDHVASFASNEICINWNAPAVFTLGYLQANHSLLVE